MISTTPASKLPTFPRVKAYIDALPEGWDCCPTYHAKGALLLHCLEVKPLAESSEMPSQLQRVLRQPPLASEWISEATYCAVNLAIADHYHLDETGFRQFYYDVMSRMATSRIYQLLFGFVTPDTLLGAAARYWGRFHQGVSLRAVPRGNDGILYTVTWPTGLVPELVAHGYAGVFERVAELSRRGKPRIEIVQIGASGAAYRLHQS
ncbi:MAG: hypothetical protein H6718_34895 [Polyangiaceae bacterium]|nr:hypothetical protein [Myxococcales bacterium]MCB9590647.1 hypothetical protein [Polyangiaceae bacterium]